MSFRGGHGNNYSGNGIEGSSKDKNPEMDHYSSNRKDWEDRSHSARSNGSRPVYPGGPARPHDGTQGNNYRRKEKKGRLVGNHNHSGYSGQDGSHYSSYKSSNANWRRNGKQQDFSRGGRYRPQYNENRKGYSQFRRSESSSSEQRTDRTHLKTSHSSNSSVENEKTPTSYNSQEKNQQEGCSSLPSIANQEPGLKSGDRPHDENELLDEESKNFNLASDAQNTVLSEANVTLKETHASTSSEGHKLAPQEFDDVNVHPQDTKESTALDIDVAKTFFDESDAETVISESFTQSRLRSLSFQRDKSTSRKGLKRKVISSSDDEEDEEEDVDDGNSSIKSEVSLSKSKKLQTIPAGSGIEKYDLTESKLTHTGSNSTNDASGSSYNKNYKIKRDSTGRSQLQRACKKGDLDEVKLLISKGASPNECDFGGFTCLHEAALAGHSEIVLFLIEKGADVNKQAFEAGDLETPLMDACENKHLETVEILLRHGADPHTCNVDGYLSFTKLQRLQASDKSYKPILELLEKYYSTSMDSQDKESENTLKVMVEDSTESYFSDLMKKKVNNIYLYAAQGQKEATAEHFITHALDLRKMPDILFLAARNGHIELVDILLGLNPKPFDINQKNRLGSTVLQASVGRGFRNVVQFLLSRGADPTIKRDLDGKDALQIAKSSTLCDPKEVVMLGSNILTAILMTSDPLPDTATRPIEKGITKKGNTNSSNAQERDQIKKETPLKIDSIEEEPAEVQSSLNFEVPGDVTFQPSVSGDEDIDSEGGNAHVSLIKSANIIAGNNVTNSITANTNGELSTAITKEVEKEELDKEKLKAAEEAKVWQEKVQAKKRARKEMFLQAEKEKEMRRKEDEELRLKERKAREERERVESLKKAAIAEQQILVAERMRNSIELQYIYLNYPSGLKDAFSESISSTERALKYAPLYIFAFKGEECVLDLQVSLLMAQNIDDIHAGCQTGLSDELDLESKDKLWPLFFTMIGISKKGTVDVNGRKKFTGLSLRFLRLSTACDYIKSRDHGVYDYIWENKRVTRVILTSMETVTIRGSLNRKVISDQQDLGFVPPKLKKRRDVVRAISMASNALW